MAGYGRLLRVNLSTGDMRQEDIPDQVKKDFIGGRGFGAKYLYDEVAPGVDPLSPDNKLLFVVGPLAGTNAQSVSRWMVVTKSPATGTFARAVAGADFGAWMRFAGLNMIIIEGKAEKPVYLYIEDGQSQIRDAAELWGKDTQETQEWLQQAHGRRVRSACIGPAGEKLVRFASITSRRRTASRGGVGTVMGSKNLKAIAINAGGRVELHDPDAFKEVVQQQIEAIKANPGFSVFRDSGTIAGIWLTNASGIYPVRNFQEGQLDNYEGMVGEYASLTKRNEGCYSCMIQCGKVRSVPSGPYKGSSDGPEYESAWAFSGTIDSSNVESTIAADRLCDELGMDTISAGNAIGFAFELFEKGILTQRDTDGLDLSWGNHGALVELIGKIGRREGLGDLLAEGVQRAAERIGKGAEDYAMHVKGLEIPAYEPRGAKAHGMSFATSNMGPQHNYGYAGQELMSIPIPREVDRFADEGKGDIVKFNQDFCATFEVGIVCVFPFLMYMVTSQSLGQMLLAVTGIPEHGDPDYLGKVGERIYNLERAFNVREGFSRKDDTLPKRMLTEPLKKGPSEGQIVRQDVILDEYYDVRGWTRNGIPTPERLRALGLEDVTKDMEPFVK